MTEPRVDLRDVDGQLVGRLALAGTVAVLEDADDRMPDFLDGLTVVLPGAGPVTMKSGESYLRALPHTLRGPYLSATFVAAA